MATPPLSFVYARRGVGQNDLRQRKHKVYARLYTRRPALSAVSATRTKQLSWPTFAPHYFNKPKVPKTIILICPQAPQGVGLKTTFFSSKIALRSLRLKKVCYKV